jgi:peptide/nickel transport system substrate-binding protein
VVRRQSFPSGSLRLLAAAASISLIATACSGSSSKGGGTGGPSASTATSLAPKAGGSLTISTEAEVTSGFDPFNSDWDATGLSYAATVMDPLMAEAADGTFKPYLAQSMTPNADYTAWTIKARPNITFSDGEPFNADAMVLDFQQLLKSPLTSPVLNDVAGATKVDDLTIQVTMKPKSACPTCGPWTVFDGYMASQLGFMVAPKAVADPNRAQHPIGTGPFVFKEWVPGDHFTATKNPTYWRKDASGIQLPYLDQVTFKPIIDPQSRENSLLSGTIQLMHTTDTQSIGDLRTQKSVQLIEQTQGRVEQDFIMLNTSKAPLDDVRIREALAMSLDQNRYNQVYNFGLVKGSTGPYSDNSGFTNAPGYPAYNPTMAKQLVQQYEADHHTNKVEFAFGNTNTGRGLQANNLIADMWAQVGITAHVVQIEQSQYILNAVTGSYQAYGWRQFGEPDPDFDVTWWASDKANPPLATNFARNKDPKIDADLADARSTNDQAKRKADYEDVSARFNQDLPYIWTNQTLWVYAAKPSVQNVTTGHTLPDGSPARGELSGIIVPTQLWVNG